MCNKNDFDNDKDKQYCAGKIKPVYPRREKDGDNRCNESAERDLEHGLLIHFAVSAKIFENADHSSSRRRMCSSMSEVGLSLPLSYKAMPSSEL